MSDFGKYHADLGAVKALELRDNGDGTSNIAVFSDGKDGSGLSAAVEFKFNVKKGTEVGEFSS